MGTKAIDPQAIRNVTLVGDPDETARVMHRLLRPYGKVGSSAQLSWALGRIEHTVRIAELSSHLPIARLERFLRSAEGLIIAVDAAAHGAARFETILRIADDHQVARLCLVSGLDQPGADFDRWVRALAETRGATPLPLQIPLGSGPEFDGVVDLISMWDLEPMPAEIFGNHSTVAEQRYRTLIEALTEPPDKDADSCRELRAAPPELLQNSIRHRTRIGDVVPVLCGMTSRASYSGSLVEAIIRYLPSPLDICQPEHVLDW
ncbi:hypothetical protein IU474_05790 [Nocardia otitidiscaviarum]|uniref:hypothetical protein n=1 Tax=Nocardia otitidiscaviarum TaxID=1823 RepID=UPI001893EDE2|nr:hypothetical protein [Nocardia otitidiscaviarum]MBF6236589.1 hypothetical protein [Nocardia otitidiscaviarum]